ncbi:hypothetical protein ACJIZ3_011228 [Penstemon smallii]|uniref:Protein Jade-1 n=1 Tax=Penstemon smallii TaxID=265156 RepID=A0ABD3UKQ7_9LAMI
MDNKNFHGLPPLKRFKLIHQQLYQESTQKNQCLPAKKRKEYPNFNPNSTYCLPAKKRIFALPPFVERTPEKPKKKSINEQDVDCDDGIVCSVCQSTDGDPTDPIVLCDGCDLMAHATCYGHPFTNGIPQGDWFCDQCLASSKNFDNFSCCLCSVSGGALKPTTDNKWAHLVCAIYVPEVFFEDAEGRRGIDCSRVLKRRWNGICCVCESKSEGCVIDCSEPNCGLAFHVTCGLKEDLCIEYRQGKKKNKGDVVVAFCSTHTHLWKKQEQTGKFKIVARDEHEEEK